MGWILLATAGQFINAIVAILDKYIVTDERAVPKPFVYAFYSCLVAGGWLIVYVLGLIPGAATLGLPKLASVQVPTLQVVAMSFLAGYTLFMALVSMYTGLKKAAASDVMPVIGAIAALSTFGLSYVFLNEPLSPNFIWGIAFLSVGTFLVSEIGLTSHIIKHALHSGVFFALHIITLKGLFLETSFDDGFFWSRVGFVLFALSLLLVPVYWGKIRQQTTKATPRSGLLVLTAKGLAGVAAFLILKATDLGNVPVVQALDGLKFVFIIVLSIVIGFFLPAVDAENDGLSSVLRKVLYVVIICFGFAILFV